MIIQVQGKDVGLKFNNYAIEQLSKVKGSGNSYYAFIATLVWCGHLGYTFAKQVESVVDFEAVTEWVDSSVNNPEVGDEIKKVYDLYTECEAYKKMQKKSELNGVESEAILIS